MKHTNYKIKLQKNQEVQTLKTGNEVLDNFISAAGGFVVGSAIFLTGTPGAGKTTLAVVLQKLLEKCKTSLYSREMSSTSVIMQMQRYKVDHANAFISDKSMCKNIEEYKKELDELKPSFVVIDSLQMIIEEDYENSPPEAACFKVIQYLRDWTDKNNAVLIVIGHVNKDGSFTGKNTIGHLFDAHLEMIFDKTKNTRTLSWSKNRKGPIDDPLFYEFGDESIEFYTKEQYQRIKNGKELEDYVLEAVVKFMKSLDTKSPNYKMFKAEITKEINIIMKNNKVFIEAAIKCVEAIQRKVDKYKI